MVRVMIAVGKNLTWYSVLRDWYTMVQGVGTVLVIGVKAGIAVASCPEQLKRRRYLIC